MADGLAIDGERGCMTLEGEVVTDGTSLELLVQHRGVDVWIPGIFETAPGTTNPLFLRIDSQPSHRIPLSPDDVLRWPAKRQPA